MFPELDNVITCEEIQKACKELNINKATGPDLMLNEFFKCDIGPVNDYLYVLFNKLLDSGYFPKEWGESFIIPLHKKGSMNNVENYR